MAASKSTQAARRGALLLLVTLLAALLVPARTCALGFGRNRGDLHLTPPSAGIVYVGVGKTRNTRHRRGLVQLQLLRGHVRQQLRRQLHMYVVCVHHAHTSDSPG